MAPVRRPISLLMNRGTCFRWYGRRREKDVVVFMVLLSMSLATGCCVGAEFVFVRCFVCFSVTISFDRPSLISVFFAVVS